MAFWYYWNFNTIQDQPKSQKTPLQTNKTEDEIEQIKKEEKIISNEIKGPKNEEKTVTNRWDYIIVVDKNIKNSKFYNDVVKFLDYLQTRGVDIKADFGNIQENIYLKLQISEESIQIFAEFYDVNVKNLGHYFLPMPMIHLNIFQTPFTLNRDFFKRDGVVTNSERILILYRMLSRANFGEKDETTKYGIHKLLSMGAVKAAYPLHDGPYQTEKEPAFFSNDRQILFKYWANFSMWYKEQPLNLIEKYYGSEVAFYFAWLGFYNKMLIPASVFGVICFIRSILDVIMRRHATLEEICNSELLLCPKCLWGTCAAHPLKMDCLMSKIHILFDNYFTVFFAIFMSFWAVVFVILWERYENVLNIRWNVTADTVVAHTQTRLPYKEKTKRKRVSPVTGQIEPYTPPAIQFFYGVLSYASCLLLICIVLSAVAGVVMYRITMTSLIKMSGSHFLKMNSVFLTACTSSIIQVIFIKIYGKFYGPFSEWITKIENPRTQFEFDNSVAYKRYILGFANNYSSLFYMSFFKGHFYTPANTEVVSIKTDLCPIRGCIVPVCIQLLVIMLLKSMAGNILTLVLPKITKKKEIEVVPQWEEEFKLYPSGRYLLTTEFMEMIIQYGFLTFFVAAFPLAPLCALINNCIELRLDAYKLVTRYRRPVPKRQTGIGPWRGILKIITHFSIVTNAFVLFFLSNVIIRQVYKFKHGGLEGYINSTLSIYDINDVNYNGQNVIGMSKNLTLCYYKGLRNPPNHPQKYELSSQYWYELGLRLIGVLIFEHVILITRGVFAFFIPKIPKKVRKTLYYEKSRRRDAKLEEMNEDAKRIWQTQKAPKLKLN